MSADKHYYRSEFVRLPAETRRAIMQTLGLYDKADDEKNQSSVSLIAEWVCRVRDAGLGAMFIRIVHKEYEAMRQRQAEAEIEGRRSNRGQIKMFSSVKGYGFIRCEDEVKDIFLHIKDWQGLHLPQTGQVVDFVYRKLADGRLRATVAGPVLKGAQDGTD